jgi:hypothetical protein
MASLLPTLGIEGTTLALVITAVASAVRLETEVLFVDPGSTEKIFFSQ